VMRPGGVAHGAVLPAQYVVRRGGSESSSTLVPARCAPGGGTRTHNLRINSLIRLVFAAVRIGRKGPVTCGIADQR
jgi:hypothetical protein